MLGPKIKDILTATDYLSSTTNNIAVNKATFPLSSVSAEDTIVVPGMMASGEVSGIESY